MNLRELAFASFVFSRLDSDAYRELLDEVNGCVNLSMLEHRLASIRWLSKWGIRAIPKSCFHAPSDMSEQMKSWHEKNKLFGHSQSLSELTEPLLGMVGGVYENLMKVNYIGPTAAAKMLFVIRPKALMAWDEPIRKKLQFSGTPQSYMDFLRWVQARIEEIREACKSHGFGLADLPNKLARPDLTIPKIMDEYLWITITRNCKPSNEDFQRWAEWY